MSLMRSAQETLRQWRSESLAVPIVYRRRGLVVESRDRSDSFTHPFEEPPIEGEIEGTIAQTTVTLDNGETISKSKVTDWLIDVDQFEMLAELASIPPYSGDVNGPTDVAIGGRYVLQPMRGDEIDYDGKRYQVADIAGEHCWRWHGTLK